MKIDERQYQDETRDGYFVSSEQQELWNVLLKLGLELKRICEKYDIRYFLHAGSLLGAVRHGGFIPWDDDMDFIILRDDFKCFLQAAEKEIGAPFYLQTPENSGDIFNNGRYLLRMQDTTGVQFIRNLYRKANQGIAIDILVLDYCPDNLKLRKMQWKRMDRCAGMMFLKKYGAKTKRFSTVGWGYLKTRVMYYMSKLVPERLLIKGVIECPQKYKDELTEFYTSYQEILGGYRHNLIPVSAFEDTIMMKFEEYYFPVPSGYDTILKTYYGNDYMELPPEEERKGHHNPVLSVTEDYVTVLNHFQGIFCNTKGKKIIIFGAGKMLEHYLKHTASRCRPSLITDNDSKKWGLSIEGILVVPPSELCKLPLEERHIIICSIHYKAIAKQLESMGICDYYIYVQNENWI